MARLCQSRKDSIPAGVAPGYRRHMGSKDSTMLKDSEKRWHKMHGKKGACQYDLAAASAHTAGVSNKVKLRVRVESRLDFARRRVGAEARTLRIVSW